MFLFPTILLALAQSRVGAPMTTLTGRDVMGAFDLPITTLGAGACVEKRHGSVSARVGSRLADGSPAAEEDPK